MWVARNKNGTLMLFNEKPVRTTMKYRWDFMNDIWMSRDYNCGSLIVFNTNLFAELTWDDEPLEVELVPKMVNAVQEKLSEAVDNYFDYIGHVQDIHPYSKEQEQEYYNNMCWRWQDWNTVKYDPKSTWDLNFEDYVDSTR